MTWLTGILGSFFANVLKFFAAYYKGKIDAYKEVEVETLKKDLEAVKQLQNVKINTTRDAALERLRKHGKVRD